MGRIVLITGGARSGKSAHALSIAESGYRRRAFVATAVALDDEMRERIARHREERGERFTTVEEPYDIAGALRRIAGTTEVAVVDCLTVWLGNLFHLCDGDPDRVDTAIEELAESVGAIDCDLVIVTNEVGWGIVPEHPLGRAFRDAAGRLNTMIAGRADRVVLCCCGIPTVIKG
jgi:adenosylcobinamide kinase/adenosylcobinamide-phosphate guanylyltransferase